MNSRDLAALAGMTLIWGSTFMLLHVAGPEFGPVLTAELRLVIGAGVLLVVGGRPALREIAAHRRTFLALGFFFAALPFILVPFAQLTLPSSMAAILNALTPLFTAVVALAWIGLPLTRRMLAGFALGIVGLVVLLGLGDLPLEPATFVAVGAMLAAALSYGIGGTLVKRRLGGVSPKAITLGQFGIGAALLLPLSAASMPDRMPSLAAIAAVVLVGVFATAVAFLLYYRVLKNLGPTIASTSTMAAPVVGVAWGALLFGESVGPSTVLGIVMVLASLVLVLGLPVGQVARRAAVRLHLPRPIGPAASSPTRA